MFGGNFHSIAPKVNQGRPPEMANVIGKYLVAPHQAQAQTKAQTQDRGRNYNKYKAVNAPLRPTASSLTTAHQRNKWVSGEQPLDLDLDLDPTSTSNGCHWLALRNFGNLTLATGLVLVRDTNEQPVYFLSLRAFIKLNDGLYFPLRNFRAHPAGAYKLEFEDEQQQQLSSSQKTSASSASTGTSTGSQTSTNQRLVLNCSLANSNSNEQASNGGGPVARVSLMSAQRANRVFAEEITIQVSCGYLVLRLRGNGTYLVLVGIAFYQDGDAVASRTTTALRRQQQAPPPQKQINPTPSMRSEHLVFSTWPQAESGANQELPLIFMPSYSRYFCQSRVVLTGNNSVQLVLERFELMRLASGASSPESQRARRHARQAPGDSAATAATTTILYKSSPNAGKCWLEPLGLLYCDLMGVIYASSDWRLFMTMTQSRLRVSHFATQELPLVSLKGQRARRASACVCVREREITIALCSLT